jgi:uncharacterized membrane protein
VEGRQSLLNNLDYLFFGCDFLSLQIKSLNDSDFSKRASKDIFFTLFKNKFLIMASVDKNHQKMQHIGRLVLNYFFVFLCSRQAGDDQVEASEQHFGQDLEIV